MILVSLGFFLKKTTQFNKNFNLFCLLILTLEFLFAVFLIIDTIHFHCFYMNKIRQMYSQLDKKILTTYFIAFDFFVLSNLKSNPNNLYQSFFSQLIRWLFDVPKHFIDSFKNIKIFFIRINFHNYSQVKGGFRDFRGHSMPVTMVGQQRKC